MGRLIANRYLVEGCCERSVASASYRAYHIGLDRSVLLRLLPEQRDATREACRRGLAIAERIATLSNPHLGRTLDMGLIEGRFPFAVYEYSKGRSLAAWLEQTGPFASERVIAIGKQIAGALASVHEAGALHGDLKLDAFWLESLACRPEWVRVLGFGLAELSRAKRDAASSGVFPNSSRLDVAAAHLPEPAVLADIHALGACLQGLAGGPAPSRGGSPSSAESLAARAWTGPGSAARGLSSLIQRCLQLQPGAAYRSMSEVCRDFERLESGGARSASELPRNRPPVITIHAPAPRARVAMAQPKVIVKSG